MSEMLRPHRNLVPKTAHAAIVEGVVDGIHDSNKIGKVESLFRESKDELVGLYNELSEDPKAMTKVRDVGYASAAILTNPALKCAKGGNETLRGPDNTQLVREILSSAAIPGHCLEVGLAIGGSEAPPSLRLVAYVDAAIQVADSFVPTGLAIPAVRVFNAHRISSAINGLNPDVAAKRAEQASHLSRAYVDSFYPYLARHIQIEELGLEEIDGEIFEHDAGTLELLLESDEQLMNPREKTALDSLKRLRRAAAKNYAGSDTSIDAIICGYAACHGQSYRNYGFTGVSGVFKVGGRGEANFDVLQQYLTEIHEQRGIVPVTNRRVDGSVQLVSLRSRAGDVPPYYPQKDNQGRLEPTVETPANDVPATIEELKVELAGRGFLSAPEFDNLSASIRQQLPAFFKDYLASRQNV